MTNPEEYQEAVTTMPRTSLEKFALQAAQTMEDLERENAQLNMDIEDAKKIDVEVIEAWRQWSQTLDEERDKWANLATRLSREREEINNEYKHSLMIIEALLRILGDIEIAAIEHSKEGTKTLQLRAGFKKIIKITQETVDKYSKVDEESEAESLAEDADESS